MNIVDVVEALNLIEELAESVHWLASDHALYISSYGELEEERELVRQARNFVKSVKEEA